MFIDEPAVHNENINEGANADNTTKKQNKRKKHK